MWGPTTGSFAMTPRVIMLTLLHNFLDSRLSLSAGPRCRAFFRRFFRLNLFNLLITTCINTNHPPFFKIYGSIIAIFQIFDRLGSDSLQVQRWKAKFGRGWTKKLERCNSNHEYTYSRDIAIYNCC